MKRILGNLQPKRLWELFEDICQVPRPSKKRRTHPGFFDGLCQEA